MSIDVPSTNETLDSLPPKDFSSVDVVTRVLRKIGAFSVNDTAADDVDIAEGLYWLEMLIAEVVGTQDCFWLTANTITLPLEVGEDEYVLAEIPGFPTQGVTFITGVWVRDSAGNDTPIDIVRRKLYESQSNKTTAGTPEQVYINRQVPKPSLITYPTISAEGFFLRLLAQTYNPSVLGVKGNSTPTGARKHGFGQEWTRFLVYALSAELGDGPVRKVDKADIKDWREVAQVSLNRLNAYSNRERRLVGRTQRWGEMPTELRSFQKRRW